MFEVLHYKPRKISGIEKTDSRVAVVGKVVDRTEKSFVLDDGGARAEILFEGVAEKNKIVRVFCSIVDGKLKADITQSLNGFDLNLFNKVEELYSRAGLDV